MEKINVWRSEEAISPENETAAPVLGEYDEKQEEEEEDENQLEEDEQTEDHEEDELLLKPEEGDNIIGQEGSIATLWPGTEGEAVEEGDDEATAMLVDIDCVAPKVVDEPTIWMDEDDDDEDVVWQVCCLLCMLFSLQSPWLIPSDSPSPCAGPAIILVIQYIRYCAMSSVSLHFVMSPFMFSLHLFFGRLLLLLPETSSLSDFAHNN